MRRDEWPPMYHALAAEFDAAAKRVARSERRSRLRRVTMAVAVALLLVGCGAGGAALLLSEGPPVRLLPGMAIPDRPVGSVRFGPIVHDPRGALPWTVRAYRAASGKVCVAAGQIMGERFGLADPRAFRALPLRSRGVCVAVMPHRVATVVDSGGAVTIVYGVAGDAVTEVELHAGRANRRVPVGPYGCFIAVVAGRTRLEALSVVSVQ